MTISSKSNIITNANATRVPIRNLTDARTQKVVQVSESYAATTAADWTNLPGVTTPPVTQDDGMDKLAAAISVAVKTVKAQYDFSVDGGVQGAIALGVTIPDNAVITQVVTDILTATDDASSGCTIRLNIPTDGNLAPAIAKGATGLIYSDPDTGSADVPTKTTGARELQATIATTDLTAGKINWFVTYFISD